MKPMIKILVASMTMTLSSLAIATVAQGFSPTELIQATTASMDVFNAANADHITHLTGFKTWKSGADAKVKFYVAHDGMNMEFNYLCLKSENQIRCNTAQ